MLLPFPFGPPEMVLGIGRKRPEIPRVAECLQDLNSKHYGKSSRRHEIDNKHAGAEASLRLAPTWMCINALRRDLLEVCARGGDVFLGVLPLRGSVLVSENGEAGGYTPRLGRLAKKEKRNDNDQLTLYTIF